MCTGTSTRCKTERETHSEENEPQAIFGSLVCYNNISPYLMSFIFNDFVRFLLLLNVQCSHLHLLACASLLSSACTPSFGSFVHSVLMFDSHLMILLRQNLSRIIIYDPNKCLGLANYLLYSGVFFIFSF